MVECRPFYRPIEFTSTCDGIYPPRCIYLTCCEITAGCHYQTKNYTSRCILYFCLLFRPLQTKDKFYLAQPWAMFTSTWLRATKLFTIYQGQSQYLLSFLPSFIAMVNASLYEAHFKYNHRKQCHLQRLLCWLVVFRQAILPFLRGKEILYWGIIHQLQSLWPFPLTNKLLLMDSSWLHLGKSVWNFVSKVNPVSKLGYISSDLVFHHWPVDQYNVKNVKGLTPTNSVNAIDFKFNTANI